MEKFDISYLSKQFRSLFEWSVDNTGRNIIYVLNGNDKPSLPEKTAPLTSRFTHNNNIPAKYLVKAKKVTYRSEIKKKIKEIFIESAFDSINEDTQINFCRKIIEQAKIDPEISPKVVAKWEYEAEKKHWDNFFTDIIITAALRKNNDSTEATIDNQYLNEVFYRCPICGTNLIQEKKGIDKGEILRNYRIIKIKSHRLSSRKLKIFRDNGFHCTDLESYDNKIAVCIKHATDYETDATEEQIIKLIKAKRDSYALHKIRELTSETELPAVLYKVINTLRDNLKNDHSFQAKSSDKTDISLIEDKISPEFFFLKEKIKLYSRYSETVANIFSLCDNGYSSKSSEETRHIIERHYQEQRRIISNQETIFANLIDWMRIQSGLGNSFDSEYEVILSYFVQSCSVFEPIDKCEAYNETA
ncbi:MAG: hypothetical protein IJI41_12510 [Anaerolineaceae bacterium]|nr:hypothetical protein [Anaerolineaceae bacterium]